MTCISNSGLYVLETRNKSGYCNLTQVLNWLEIRRCSSLLTILLFLCHVPVMSEETTSNMMKERGKSQGTQTKTNKLNYKAQGKRAWEYPEQHFGLPSTSSTVFSS